MLRAISSRSETRTGQYLENPRFGRRRFAGFKRFKREKEKIEGEHLPMMAAGVWRLPAAEGGGGGGRRWKGRNGCGPSKSREGGGLRRGREGDSWWYK